MTATRLIFAFAGLAGAAGVGLMAAGTHAAGQNAMIAGQILLFHASAAMAATLARKAGFLREGPGRFAVALLLAGAALFAADLSRRAFSDAHLFPMAAPAGGMAMIAGWLALAFAALWGRRV